MTSVSAKKSARVLRVKTFFQEGKQLELRGLKTMLKLQAQYCSIKSYATGSMEQTFHLSSPHGLLMDAFLLGK